MALLFTRKVSGLVSSRFRQEFYSSLSIKEQVQSNKDLDLPTQQELLAQFRCDEISALALSEFNEQAKSQKKPVEAGKVVESLGAMMRSWRSVALCMTISSSCTLLSENTLQHGTTGMDQDITRPSIRANGLISSLLLMRRFRPSSLDSSRTFTRRAWWPSGRSCWRGFVEKIIVLLMSSPRRAKSAKARSQKGRRKHYWKTRTGRGRMSWSC